MVIALYIAASVAGAVVIGCIIAMIADCLGTANDSTEDWWKN